MSKKCAGPSLTISSLAQKEREEWSTMSLSESSEKELTVQTSLFCKLKIFSADCRL